MGAAIGLREDFGSADLRVLARSSKDANQARRLLALAVIYDGGWRTEAARTGGVGLQIIRDWVRRFNASGLGADQRQGAGQAAEAERRSAGGSGGNRRARADPGDPRGGALAADRSDAVGLGRVRHLAERGDDEP